MNKLAYGRLKRLNAEFRGDEAVEIELLEVSLRMGNVARTRVEADTMLVRLALKALTRAIDEYCVNTGQRYPSYRTLGGHLDGEKPVDGEEPAASRIVNLQK